MNWLVALLAILALTPDPGGAPAEPPQRVQFFMTVAALERYCSAPENDPEGLQDLCVGYIAGVIDQISLRAEVDFATYLDCPTRAITIGDFRDSFLSYARRFPQEAQMPASPILEFTSSNLITCMLRNPVGA